MSQGTKLSAEHAKLLDKIFTARGGFMGYDVMGAMEQLSTVEYTDLMTAYAAALLSKALKLPPGAPWPPTEKRDDYGFRDVDGPRRQPMIDAVMGRLVKLTQARSVVDLGCGTGRWLASCLAHGATEVVGVDAYPADDRLMIPTTSFVQAELREPVDLGRTFDAAVCLWLGECIEEKHAETLVRTCVAAAPVVCFAAATPLSTGPRPWFHEEWPSYWARLFLAHDYVPLEILRDQLWNVPECRPKLTQALILFVKRDHLPRLPGLASARVTEDLALLDRVHPNEYLSMTHDYMHIMQIEGMGD